jgi:chemotaxis protein methyltransferase CheR
VNGLRGPDPAPITRTEFAAFQELIHRRAGIFLADGKQAMLTSRLARRLRELAEPSFGHYFRRVCASEEELELMLDCVSTNETKFFREPRHFTLLESQILPRYRADAMAARRGRRIRAWSAGCSSGEEAYSLGMVLLHGVPLSEGFRIEVLATDLSTRALRKAREATYPLERAKEIPEPLLKGYMLRGTGRQEGRMKAGPELQGVVRFERLNLAEPLPSSLGVFDIIFCRNVLIYFSPERRQQVIHRLLQRLVPEGILFVGHAESLAGIGQRVAVLAPTVYALLPEAEPRGGNGEGA